MEKSLHELVKTKTKLQVVKPIESHVDEQLVVALHHSQHQIYVQMEAHHLIIAIQNLYEAVPQKMQA
jgi:hypothetical protein